MHIMTKVCRLLRKKHALMFAHIAHSDQVKILKTKFYLEIHV